MSLSASRSHDVLSGIIRKRKVSLEDVLVLRRQIWPDGAVSRGEAEMLFRIDAALDETCAEWTDLFIETVTGYLVEQAHPFGCLSDADAAWLEQRILQDGRIASASGLELLVRVLERATHVPHRLEMLALETVETAVRAGDWKLLSNKRLERGILGDPEVALLRRVLYSEAGSQSVGLSRDEAEFLCGFDETTSDAVHCAAWAVLFANALGNYLLTHSGYEAPPRAVLKTIDAWLNRPGSDVGGFLLETLQGAGELRFDTVSAAFAGAQGSDAVLRRSYRLGAEGKVADPGETRWLIERLTREGPLTANEQALLMFLRQGGFEIDPALRRRGLAT